jgi:O-antigen biosynthesis protein WbqP
MDLYGFLKRLIDIIGSVMGLIVLLPILLILSLAIKIDSKGPVLFKQKRIGKNKTHFNAGHAVDWPGNINGTSPGPGLC